MWRAAEEPAPEPLRHDAVIVLGGAMNAHDEERMPWLVRRRRYSGGSWPTACRCSACAWARSCWPQAAGGSVRPASRPEIGWHEVRLEPGAGDDPLTGALPASFYGFQWHSYEAVPPAGSVALARSDGCLQAFRLNGTPAWGIQFHAEVTPDRAMAGSRGYHTDPDAVRLGVGPRRAAGRDGAPDRAVEPARARPVRALPGLRRRRAYSGVR